MAGMLSGALKMSSLFSAATMVFPLINASPKAMGLAR